MLHEPKPGETRTKRTGLQRLTRTIFGLYVQGHTVPFALRTVTDQSDCTPYIRTVP